MLRFGRLIKPWKESAALNAHINLYGFWNDTTSLTKSGDVGMVLLVTDVDYESLDHSEQEYAVKRLEAALKSFGPGFHVYQYLFKSNRPDIPFATYDDPVVQAAINQRRKFFEAKGDHLYQIEINVAAFPIARASPSPHLGYFSGDEIPLSDFGFAVGCFCLQRPQQQTLVLFALR
jgi:hypothetical protein